jgi:chaperonin GroEL
VEENVAKKLHYGNKGRLGMLAGVNLLADAVQVTLGPQGRNVVIQHRTDGVMPIFTRDGVTVARSVSSGVNVEDLGASMVRQVAAKVASEAGDGTTTAVVLTRRIAAEAVKVMGAGVDQKSLREGMEIAVRAVIDDLKARARKCEGREDIVHIGAMACNGDRAIAGMLADAVERVGHEGVISLELGTTCDDQLEFVEGARWEQGYPSRYFVTDRTREIAELENPYVLLYDRVIHRFEELIPILDQVKKAEGSLLIVAENVEEAALPGVLLNHIRRTLKAVVVKPPVFGDRRGDALADLAALLGGKAILEACGDDLARVKLCDLGRARRVVVGEDSTTVIGGAGDPEAIAQRRRVVRQEADRIRDGDPTRGSAVGKAHDLEGLEERIRRLSGQAAVVRVGGRNDLVIKERMQRFENALNAIRGAMSEGVLPGGGAGLLRARKALDRLPPQPFDVQCGVDVIRTAIGEPARLICLNAGEDPRHAAFRILESQDEFWGLDARRREFGDLRRLGVLDPLRVTRLALREAASAAASIMITECVVTRIPPEDPLYGYTPEWAAETREDPRI